MQTTIPGIVRFQDKAATDLALETEVGLITFRNAQARIQTARESGIEHAELFDQRRIDGERLGKLKIRGDECAALGVAHQLARGRIDQRVRVKEKLLRAQREIVNRAQQRAVIKNSRAAANYRLAGLERIVRESNARPEVVPIVHDAFVFITYSIAQHQIRFYPPLVLRKNSDVGIVLGRSRQKVLPEAAGQIRQKVAGAVEIPGAAGIAQIYESGFDLLHVAAKLQRMVAAEIGEDLLELKASLAAIGSAAGRSAGHERAACQLQRIVDSNQHHGRPGAAGGYDRRSQA